MGKLAIGLTGCLVIPFATCPALAQSTPADTATTAAEAATAPQDDGIGIAEVVVTAQKRGVAERAQDVPIAITAFNRTQLDQVQLRDLQTLTSSTPNVVLDQGGTLKGTANFSIRGFGVVGTVPSLEPAVGVFVNGIYQGIPSGSVTDLFDVESIEILRGPQGTLFGRNTTGGAATISTTRPGRQFEATGKLSVETGPEYTAALAVGGPVTDTLRARIAGYYSNDRGWFRNDFDGQSVGRTKTSFFRPTIVWEPSTKFDTTLIYERGTSSGDGPVGTNPAFTSGFDVNYDNVGFTDQRWHSLTNEMNLKVGLGDGIITNLVGIRDYRFLSFFDIDLQPRPLFNSTDGIRQHQFSEELRYTGTFGGLKLTTGVFYFHQLLRFVEERALLNGASRGSMGGFVNQDGFAAFAEGEYAVSEQLSFILGGRYSIDKKRAEVRTYSSPGLCTAATATCSSYNFPTAFPGVEDPKTWRSFTPKVGFRYKAPSDNLMVYGSWSQGIRSGGYNVKSTAPAVPPGPYGQERQNAFELGFKSDFAQRRVRLNGAAFYNRLGNLQRDINTADPLVGIVQITSNVGTARVYGAETELSVTPVRGLILGGSLGYLNGKYLKLTADLNGALPGNGEGLKLVRLPKFTYALNASYTTDLASDLKFVGRVDFQHRDRTFFNDNNTGVLTPVDNLSGLLQLGIRENSIRFSLYGKNLLNKVTNLTYAPLPASLGGGAYQVLNEGRVVGFEIGFRFR